MNTTAMEPSSSSSSSSSSSFPSPTQGIKRIVSLSYEDYHYNDDRLQGSTPSSDNNHGNKRRRYMRRGSRCPSMFTTTALPEHIFSVEDDANDDSTNHPSSNKNNTMTTKRVGEDSGVYDSSSRIPMIATTLPKCFTRLPTTCISPIGNNDDEEEDEDEKEVSNNDTLEGKQEQEQEQQQQEPSQSSGLSILREALMLSDKQGIDEDDDEDDDDDEALILSAIRLLNQH
mmetsp:Transcript_29075/g.31250  ORF Transcript_29075/g.31250 Transcript_29075/m.31250 type:complete len:229 (-) Transcript_29075:204-890(-)